MVAAGHGQGRLAQRQTAGGAGSFHARRRDMHPGESSTIGDQCPDMLLLHKSPAAHVSREEGIDLLACDFGIFYGQYPGLADHVAQRNVPALSELGATHTDNGYRSHILSLPLCLAYMA
ncbi:Uncharacterised protein [uncultured archaeon]|nr:Uncharacterised protein [uncultured archaeon]